jgi:anti-anti-sigma factor
MANRLSFEQKGDVVIAKLMGRIHGSYADEVDTALSHAAKEAKYIILDLHELEFISSSGLRTFLKLRREAIDKGGAVAFARPTSSVRKIFEVASFEHLFPIIPTVEEAFEKWGIDPETGE